MSAGPTQDVAIERFLQDIEERGGRAHGGLSSGVERKRRGEMNLLYRKTRLDWRNREPDSTEHKKSSSKDASSATVGKIRDLASFRRHFRMGFLTMPASQEHASLPCAGSLAPRSLSCHSVGSGAESAPPSARRPPAKPKRHPSTRLSTASDPRCGEEGGGEKKPALKKSDSGEQQGRKAPPAKPKRSPNTQLTVSFDDTGHPNTHPGGGRTPHPRHTPTEPSQHTQTPTPAQPSQDEPVYIEMVGDVYREPQNPAGTPDSDSDQSEAIYEEMKYPLSEDASGIPKTRDCKNSTNPSLVPPPPHLQNSAKGGKPKWDGTPNPAVSPSPQPARTATPFSFSKNCDIPPPFPNLLQHRHPLLAFPQPAASSSGVNVAQKGLKLGTVSVQTGQSKLPVLQNSNPPSASQAAASAEPAHTQRGGEGAKDLLLLPSGRARSHSTPLPPPPNPQNPQKSEKEMPGSHSMKLGQSMLPVPQQQPAAGKDKVPKPDKTDSFPPRSGTPSSRHLFSHRSSTPLPDHCMVWTYPSGGLQRPPAYESLRGSSGPALSKSSSTFPASKGSLGGARQQPPSSLPVAPLVGVGGDPKGVSSPVDEGLHWPLQGRTSCSRSHKDVDKPAEDARSWNGSGDAPKEEKGLGQSGIPVRSQAAEVGLVKGVPRSSLPQPCQTFPACHRNGDFTRLGRSASTSGVRHASTNVQRQCSLPREVLGQLQQREGPSQPPASQQPFEDPAAQSQLTAPAPDPALAQPQPSPAPALPLPLPQPQRDGQPQPQPQRDGKLLEVIERKRCLCKEIKAHRRPERSLCKQDSMPILPSWRKTPETRKSGTPPCRRQQAVLGACVDTTMGGIDSPEGYSLIVGIEGGGWSGESAVCQVSLPSCHSTVNEEERRARRVYQD
ncbi:neuronal tyrosine-phosphorylated phosphoinositide-3-kinase adapter 1-like [Polyodon spathula]|uniref:neuronal tyrosine-phosphorylated phosphoinositide-3-kinase adapter 1-like n=1 Tax=Polyodon spathula TaxID=7913 RepID=UPI001B7DBAAE|nr:neuronal tyrosine-phosphorylated phosphoinositide-3-kinase adapter 1-like [Polyodon spathula]